MTSNVGSRWIKELGVEAARERVMEELDRTFQPEFLNRIDEIILFRSLTKEDLSRLWTFRCVICVTCWPSVILS
jgi:ATP-dependent Clp protease ATP-binding subunit ClpA